MEQAAHAMSEPTPASNGRGTCIIVELPVCGTSDGDVPKDSTVLLTRAGG
jgi:hypothetical protein